jgi:hypothetical protein
MDPKAESAAGPPLPHGVVYILIFIVIAAVLNLLVVNSVRQIQCFGALALGFFLVPILNGSLALVSLVLRRRHPGLSGFQYIMLFVGVPIAAILIDGAVILSWDMRGCL